MDDVETFKRAAAQAALAYIEPGMVVGLGTGSTARHFVDLLGARVQGGLKIVGVPTSDATRAQAAALDIPLATLDDRPAVDVDVDGADEFDANLTLIKGGGGALLREKIVAAASRQMIVIADPAKMVARLGAFALPVEVNPFGIETTRRRLEKLFGGLGLAGPVTLRRRDGRIFVTDGGHFIFDCALGAIPDAPKLAAALDGAVGVVEHGLFVGLATRAIIAGPGGVLEFTVGALT